MSSSTEAHENSLLSLGSVDSGDFILVRSKSQEKQPESIEQFSEVMGDDIDLRGLNPDELNVVHSIKKLLKENEVLKSSLLRHNGLIQEYCSELENLQKQQNYEKDTTQKTIDKLQNENKHLRSLIECQAFKASTPAHSLSEVEIKTHIMPLLIEVAKNVKKVYQLGNDSIQKSLTFPVQESQSILASISEGFAVLQSSIEDCITQENEYAGHGSSGISSSQESVINDLKADLSERMKDTENLNTLRTKFSELQELNEKLLTENDKCKKFIRQQQQKIEQLECEQPSVEIMQIASPQQTRIIDSLKLEVESKDAEIKKLQEERQSFEEKLESLTEASMRKSQQTSLQIKADVEEISQIRKTYEIAIEGLKDEITAEKQKNSELLEMLKNNESQDGALKEVALLNKTIEMMRKRENKDMDKMNTLVIERNTFRKDCEEKLQVIQELTAKLEVLEQSAEQKSISEQFEVVTKVDHSLEHEKLIEELKTKAEADEESIVELKSKVSQLEAELEERTQEDMSYHQLKEDNRILAQQKSDLLDKFEEMSHIQEQLTHEQEINENLRKELHQFEVNTENMKKELHGYTRQQMADKEIIRDSKLKIAAFNEQLSHGQEEMREMQKILEDYRQRNKAFEANLQRSEKEYKSVLNNLQLKSQQSAKMEEQLKYLDELKMGMTARIKKLEDVCKNYEKQLSSRDAHIRKMNEEVETMAILKEQVRVYEADFNIEREAREKQHSDILILRDEVHHLKLENHRLREEAETIQRHQMAELQQRYGVGGPNNARPSMSQDISGLYFRGSAARDNRGGAQYQSGSVEAAQEPDQNVQRLCPKCHAPFPDLDTLQIHVLECLDE